MSPKVTWREPTERRRDINRDEKRDSSSGRTTARQAVDSGSTPGSRTKIANRPSQGQIQFAAMVMAVAKDDGYSIKKLEAMTETKRNKILDRYARIVDRSLRSLERKGWMCRVVAGPKKIEKEK